MSSVTHPDTPGQGAWELLASALPSKNPDSGTFHNIDFSVLNGKGETISFHADYIRRGEGTKGDNKISAANTIQLSKNDVDAGTKGYIYMTSGYASHIEFKTLRIYSAYNQADYSGVPAIYSADEMDKDNGEQVEVHRETSEDGNYYIYSADIPYSRFRIETSTGNAMYICYLRNLA